MIYSKALKGGFTLIELIVVMAIIGVLSSIVIVAVNPLEQIASSRDTSRLSSITQLGGALSAFRATSNGTYPTQGTTWMDTLVTSQDLGARPTNPDYVNGTPCNDEGSLGQNGFCYKTGGVETIIYSQLESTLYNKLCTSGANSQAYWVFSVGNSSACVVCAPQSVDPNITQVAVCAD